MSARVPHPSRILRWVGCSPPTQRDYAHLPVSDAHFPSRPLRSQFLRVPLRSRLTFSSRTNLQAAVAAATHPKNKSRNRGKFSHPKIAHTSTTIQPRNHHNITTKNHPKNLWKSQNPLQKRHPTCQKQIILLSNISSNQTTTVPYSAPTPSPHPAPSPPPPRPQTHSALPASSPQDRPKRSKE